MKAISVIVPTLNEADNITMLVERIAAGFNNTDTIYEILFIDDKSNDGTPDVIKSLAINYPIRFKTKVGRRGKAHSLLEGFEAAKYDILCMIDADLQYPPEAIVPMYRLMDASDTDIVLTNRQDHGTSQVRKITSAGFNFVFTKLMFGFNYDSQSGLKLFKKEVINSISLDPTPWSFDLEFIVRSLERDYKIVSYDITFAERYAGVAKIQVGKVAYELAKASVKLRLNSSPKKVKSGYRKSNRIAKKTSLAGLATAIIMSAVMLVTSVPAAAIQVSPNSILTQILDPNDTKNASPATPIVAAPTSTSPSGEVKAPLVADQSSLQLERAPSVPQTITSVAANQTPDAIRPVNNLTTGLNYSGQADSEQATYPNGALVSTSASIYENSSPSKSVGLIKPLSIGALVVAALSIGAYVLLPKVLNSRLYRSSETLKG